MARVMTLATIGALILLLLKIFSVYRSYMKKIEAAKRSGFPYILSPVFAINYGYIFLVEAIILPFCSLLPFTQKWNWVHMIGRNESYVHRRASHEKFGDTYMIVALNMIYLKTTNAELITQLVTRKNDFVKPIKDYKIVDIFGRSMLTSEGQDWRAHKKVVAPSFSEKSNKFAFEESLRQAEAMMNHWSTQGSNTEEDMRVDSTVKDTAILSLHVICAAGFGVPQLWPGEDENSLDGKGLPGLSTTKLANGHQLMFKDSLIQMLHGILNFVILEPWMLKFSPFSYQRSVYRAYDETRRYFNELLDIKKEKVYQGESDKGTMDLMGPMIKASDELPPDYDSKSGTPHKPILSRDEIISNSFIFFFAGHETSANSIHYSIIELAISPPTQQHLQFDIDSILGHKTIAEIDYIADMPRLYNSMVGAVLNEQLRLIPPIINIPKTTVGGDQKVIIDGKEYIIPDDTFVHLNCIGTNRNPRYYPYASSWITGSDCDLDDFVPERWLPSEEDEDEETQKGEIIDGLERASFETKNGLFKPVKGSFIAFSEGLRACPGKRFAQVEITAVLTAIFQRYSVELDVADWASDEEVAMMGDAQKKRVYEKAIERARGVLARLEPIVTLMMKAGDKVPVRFVERGKERFAHLFNE